MATLTRRPNPLDSRDAGAGVLKTALWGFSPPRGSSPGLGDRPRGECPGLRVYRYLFGLGISSVWKKSTNLVLAARLASSGPSRCPRTPDSNPRMSIECILGVLGFPAPLCPLSWQEESQHYKGGQGQGLASSCHEVRRRALEKGCLTVLYHVTSKGNPSVF